MPYEGVMTLLKGIRDGARTLLEFQKPSRQDYAPSTLAQAGSLPVPLQRTTANGTGKPKLPPVPAPTSGAPPQPPPKSAKEAKENEKCTIS